MPADGLPPSVVAVARSASRAGIFCDFDGSLAPIVADPARARPVRGAARVLHKLARQYGVVAVISGRPVKFLARVLPARGVRMVGLYGIEERIGRHLSVLPEVQRSRVDVDAAAERLRAEMKSFPGVYVEHKGFAVSVHFRRALDPDVAQPAAEPEVERIATEFGLHVLVRGRRVIEIGPPVAIDKGDVVRRIIKTNGLTGALVIGDDTGDLPMFAAVEGLDPVARVAVRSDEGPRELFERADVIVNDPSDVLELFRSLAAAKDR